MSEMVAPPKWILFVLWPFKGEPCYTQIEGDLSEEFQQRASEYGIADARRWYHREVCRNLASLLRRWGTISAIILPILCIVLSYPLFNRAIWSIWQLFWRSPRWSFSSILFYVLFYHSSTGLLLGVICGLTLRGHERMVRLVFGAYYLGLAVVTYPSIAIHLSNADIQAQQLLALTYRLGYLRPIWTLACIFAVSMWIEQRHRTQIAT